MTATAELIQIEPVEQKSIPEALIYETLNGQPIYFKNYQAVVNGEKTLDDIMATGRLQTLILSTLYEELLPTAKSKGLKFVFNEVGIHISLNTNFSCDLVAFDKTLLASSEDDNKYYNFPPEFVIEVDTNGDFAESKFQKYFVDKTERLLDFGAKKVIWILTASKTVTVATQEERVMKMQRWNKPIEIFDGDVLNLAELFQKNDIKIPDENLA